MASAFALQCSNQLSYEDPYMGAGRLVDFILTRERNKTENDDMNCRNINLCQDMIIAVVLAI